MSDTPKVASAPDQVWLLLGEMRGDLKYLVHERRTTLERMDALEVQHATIIDRIDARVSGLEKVRTKVAAYVALLSVLVPTALTALARWLGLI